MTPQNTLQQAQQPAQPVMRAERISFCYPNRPVFTAWSGDFAAGVTWVRGGNGSGKSTLLKLLAGALPVAAGRLVVQGVEEAAQPLDYRRQVFWCGPGAIPFEHLQPHEYFGFMRGLYPGFDTSSLAEHVAGFALQAHGGKRLSALSTGTQRKVWLAAALSAGTAAVLLDEPLNALDQASLSHLRQALARGAEQKRQAWIVASHEGLGEAGQGATLLDLDM